MKALGQVVLVLVVLYVTSYIVLRSRWTHKWDKDGKAYMHFPVSSAWLQTVFGPVCLLDGEVSGLQFRTGPHPGTETDDAAPHRRASATLPPAAPAPVQ